MALGVDAEMKFELKMKKSIVQMEQERGLGIGGRVQMYVDSEVVRRMEPYTPFLTGALIKSATAHTKIGSGEVKSVTPYAKRQYYGNKGSGRRGKMWFERMKANEKNDILRGAAKVGGANGTKV